MTPNPEPMAGPCSSARERLLAEASARLVGAGDRQTVLAVATATAAALMGEGPGCGSALLVGAGSHMTVTSATGALGIHEGHNVSTEDLPAGVRASLALGHAAQWPADLLSLGFPATGGYVTSGAVLVPLGVREATHGLLVVTGPGETRAAAEAALSVLAGQVAMTLEGLGSARWVETVVEQVSELILVLEPDATIRFANGAVRRRLGWDPSALVRTPFLDLLEGEGIETVLKRLEDLVAARSERCAAEFRLRHAGGGGVDVEGTMTSLLSAPDVRGIVLTLRDVRERKSLEAQLAHWVRHDPLTNLANRALLEDHLDTLAQAGEPFAVLLLDIDDFKAVNDRLGSHEADRLLVMAADRFRRRARAGDLVARSGGDEFVLVARGIKGTDEAEAVAARLLDTFEAPFIAGGLDAELRASIGIRLSNGSGSDPGQLLRDANLALYAAKVAGKARWVMFQPAMHTLAEEALAIRAALRQAVPNSELVLHYQPILSADTGALAGFEALVRWQHPLRGLLGPFEFIGHAEETGLIVPMGAWILEESCRKLAQLHTINPTLRMSVNLSVRQIECDEIVDHVRRALEGAGIAPSALTLEITESLLLSETAPVVQRIHELHALGVKLAIDDFGTGFSSLAYLQRLPVDTLKIDRSFVMGLDQAGSSNAVVDGIVRLSEALLLDTVAEGVESAGQLEALKAMGTVFVQGFFFSRPLDSDAATAYAQTSVSRD